MSQGLAGLPRPYDAVEVAHADAQDLFNLGFNTERLRYIWIPDEDPEKQALAAFVVNSSMSRSPLLFPLDAPGSALTKVLDGGLIRVDLGLLATDPDEFKELADTWDELNNPYFIYPVSGFEEVEVLEEVEPYEAPDENGETKVWDKKKVTKKVPIKPLFGEHVNQDTGLALQELTNCNNPVVWLNTLGWQGMHTRDKGKVKGLYYKFLGIKQSTEEGVSDLDLFLRERGTSFQEADEQDAIARIYMSRSAVTNKDRIGELLDTPSDGEINEGRVYITRDTFEEQLSDPDFNLIRHLEKPKYGGSEIIYELPNGLHGYFVTDGDDNLAFEVPPELATTREAPAPHTGLFDSGAHCMFCHGKPDEHGLKNIRNDILAIQKNFQILDDLSQKDALQAQESLRQKYRGQWEKALLRSRQDMSDTMVRLTPGVTREFKDPQTGEVKELPWQFEDAVAKLKDLWTYHLWTMVDASKAVKELGYEPGENPQQTLSILIGVPENGQEDPDLIRLLSGLEIRREHWEQVYILAASRAAKTQEDKPTVSKLGEEDSNEVSIVPAPVEREPDSVSMGGEHLPRRDGIHGWQREVLPEEADWQGPRQNMGS